MFLFFICNRGFSKKVTWTFLTSTFKGTVVNKAWSSSKGCTLWINLYNLKKMHTFNKRWSPASWKLLLQMGQVYCALSRTSTRAPSWITSSWLVLSWPAPSWLAPSWNFFDLADFRCSFSLTTAVTDSSLKCPVQSSKTNFGENWWSFKRWLNISYLIFKRWLNISYLIF